MLRALCLDGRSSALLQAGRVAEAADDARRALAVAREIGSQGLEAVGLACLAMASWQAGDRDGALRLVRQAQAIPDEFAGGLDRGLSAFVTMALIEAGDLAGAEQVCAAGLASCRELGDLANLSGQLWNRTILDLRTGRVDRAAAHLREQLQIAAQTGLRPVLLAGLDSCGHLCAATGRPGEAVTAWAAMSALSEPWPLRPWPRNMAAREKLLRKARQLLGPAGTRAAEKRGAAMSLAAAAEYALLLAAAQPPAGPSPQPLPPPAGPGLPSLSPRERELITLVAQGRTDAQIAAQLYITVRTVSSHLDRVRDKTGCRRRADLTRLALTPAWSDRPAVWVIPPLPRAGPAGRPCGYEHLSHPPWRSIISVRPTETWSRWTTSRCRWPRGKSSAFWDRTGRGRPPPSNAPSGSGDRTQGRSGCWAWIRTPTGTTIHEIVGVQLQASAFRPSCRVGEILDMYRSFYRHPADVSELVEALGLAGKLGDYYRSLSGGQRQRLSVALALIGWPKIAVLDEMTTGLDPQARRDTWELIEHMRDRGTTILLVTHFMEEAERLCDRVALIDRGRIVALDTPAGLAPGPEAGRPCGSCRRRRSTTAADGLPEVYGVERDGQHVVVTGTGDLVNAVIVGAARGRAGGAGRASRRLDAGGRLCGAHRHAPARGTQGYRIQGRSTGMSLHTLTAAAGAARRVRQDRPATRRARLASTAGMIVGIGLSPLLLVIFGSIPVVPADQREPGRPVRVGGLHPDPDRVLDRRARAGLSAGPLVSYREQGILRRLSTTPAPASGCWPRSSSSRRA